MEMIPRFKHILVPVDLTPKNKSALEIAFELAVENKAKVSLLHVTESIELNGEQPDEETAAFYEKMRRRYMTELESMAQRFAEAGVEIETKVLLGKPLQEIVSFSETHRIDLIIMSSHPIQPEDPLRSWGTLSYKVSVACACPILLVK
jgi:nucleotide-binding universal stress UspA family protein